MTHQPPQRPDSQSHGLNTSKCNDALHVKLPLVGPTQQSLVLRAVQYTQGALLWPPLPAQAVGNMSDVICTHELQVAALLLLTLTPMYGLVLKLVDAGSQSHGRNLFLY